MLSGWSCGKSVKFVCVNAYSKIKQPSKETFHFIKLELFGQKTDAYISQRIYDEYTSKHPHPKKANILISTSGTIGRTVVYDGRPAYFQDSKIVWIDNDEKLVTNEYLRCIFQSIRWTTANGGTIERLYNKLIEEIKIPLPPIEVQKQLVAEMEEQEKIIEANKKLIGIMEQKISQVLSEI